MRAINIPGIPDQNQLADTPKYRSYKLAYVKLSIIGFLSKISRGCLALIIGQSGIEGLNDITKSFRQGCGYHPGKRLKKLLFCSECRLEVLVEERVVTHKIPTAFNVIRIGRLDWIGSGRQYAIGSRI